MTRVRTRRYYDGVDTSHPSDARTSARATAPRASATPTRAVEAAGGVDGIHVKALASGSSGNALLVRAGPVAVLIDAGLPGRQLAALLRAHGVLPGGLAAILVSHEHSDHVAGAATLSRLYGAPIVANSATLSSLKLSARVTTQTLPTGATQRFGGLAVGTFAVPHDARDPVGFNLEYEGWHMCHLTDVGYDAPELEPHIAAADLIVLEANHDVETLRSSAYPWPLKNRILGRGGHLSNDQTARLLERSLRRVPRRRRWLWLAHLSQENNTPRKARDQVGLRLDLAQCIADVSIDVARRDAPSASWYSALLARQQALF